MNFSTHVLLGMLIGALFFGRLDVILLLGIGSAIPDMDREYGFFSKDVFRKHQLHRALCHNFVFLGVLYLINPFLALGAFLHTLLDALTTAKDRGVEWLYPFSRLVKKAVYDHQGKRMVLDPDTRIFMYQNDPVELTRKTAEDLKDYTPRPWRRSYGPALSGGILDFGIFIGATALLLFMLILTVIGAKSFIVLDSGELSYKTAEPLFIGASGILLVLVIGEIKRHRDANRASRSPPLLYKVSYTFSLSLIGIGVFLGAYYDPVSVVKFEHDLPYLMAGILIVLLVALIVLRIYSSKSSVRMTKDQLPYEI